MMAFLPMLLTFPLPFKDAFWQGALVCLTYWTVIVFFFGARSLFPESLVLTAFVFLLVSFGQMAGYFWNLQPYWLGSLFLLAKGPVTESHFSPHLLNKYLRIGAVLTTHKKIDESQDSRQALKDSLWIGIGFWALLACLGIFQEILNRQPTLGLSRQPAAIFLFLACSIIFWSFSKSAAGRLSKTVFGKFEGKN